MGIGMCGWVGLGGGHRQPVGGGVGGGRGEGGSFA